MGVNIGHRLWSAPPALSWYSLTWPKELDAKQVHAWLQSLGGNKASRGMRFIVVAEPGTIRHYVALPSHHEDGLLAPLALFLPGIEVTACEPVDLSATLVSKVRTTSKHRVLSTKQPDIVSHAVLGSMQALHGKERIVFEWLLGSCKSPDAIPNDITSFHSGSMTGATLEAMAGRTPSKLDTTARASMRDKHAVASWDAALYIGVTASSNGRGGQLLSHVVGALKSAEAPGVRIGSKPVPARQLSAAYTPVFWPLSINVDELCGLLAWPLGDRSVTGLTRIASRHLPIPNDMPARGRTIAASTLADSNARLTLSPADNLMHLHALGPTGVGKSTFLLNLIVQDIEHGRGVVVVDPKGDLIKDVLQRVPEKRRQDISRARPERHQPTGRAQPPGPCR